MKFFQKKISVLSVVEGYNKWSASYADEINPIKNAADILVEKFLPDLHQKSVLDAGCGTGKFCSLAEKQGAVKIVGIDLSPQMIEKAKINCPQAQFQCGDLSELSTGVSEFDVIICSLVLAHIKYLEPALQPLITSLKPKGTLIITDFHPYLTLMDGRRTFQDSQTRRTFEIDHHLHLLEEYFRILSNNRLTINKLEEPCYQNKPVVFGILATRI
jgi:malonyl-CoA O-methyltransferase